MLVNQDETTSFQAVHTKEQIEDIVRLAREIWQGHYTPIIGQKQVDYMLEKFQSEEAIAEQLGESYEYYLIIHQGQSVGYVAIVPDGNEPTLMLSKIYVRKSECGNYLGKKSLQFVENLCLKRLCRNRFRARNIDVL
ncbi:MAG TPA: hypothetical protein PK653_09855 [Syntrophales bacterium]|jgi:hypothetical protein|nr:hypothetical protein [Syntrophales bacterium]